MSLDNGNKNNMLDYYERYCFVTGVFLWYIEPGILLSCSDNYRLIYVNYDMSLDNRKNNNMLDYYTHDTVFVTGVQVEMISTAIFVNSRLVNKCKMFLNNLIIGILIKFVFIAVRENRCVLNLVSFATSCK